MSLTDDHIIEQYLAGELSDPEKDAFLARVDSEPALKDRLKLERQMREALDEADWAFAENAEQSELMAFAREFDAENTKSIKNSISEASRAYHLSEDKPKASKTRNLWVYSVAAAVIFVVTFILLKPKPVEPGVLYTEYLAKTELPDLTTRSADDEAAELLRAQGLFNNKEYERAADAFQKLIKQMPQRAELYINLALSQAELDQYEAAIANLDQLINSNLLDAQKGYWYKALVYLKADQATRAEEALKIIIDNRYYNHQLAARLLGEF